MDRTEAEKIVARDLPGVVLPALAGLPDEFAAKTYDAMAARFIEGIMDGTVSLTPEGRLSARVGGSAAFGNIPNPRKN